MPRNATDYAKVKMATMDEKTHLNAVERSRKLKSLQVTINKLDTHILQKNKVIRLAQHDVEEAEKQKTAAQMELRRIEKMNDNAPIVTEHAMLRYLERRRGIDLSEVVKEILAVPDDQKVVHGKTVITVYTDKQDHFNLAEREKS